MIKNYFLLFFRNLVRQKLFSFINLLGLTASMGSTLLIYLYVHHEFSYDRFHPDAERIYRVNQTFIWGEDSNNQFASTGPGVANALHAELPEIELMTSIHTPGDFTISYTNPQKEVLTFDQDKVLVADTNFFRMFNFPMIQGQPETALRQAQTLVMTESTARKYFGTENPIGKLVQLGGLGSTEERKTYEVTGVVKDTPDNSYIEFNVLLSMNSFPVIRTIHWSWIWTQLETFIKLDKTANLDNTKSKLALIPRKYAEETLQRAMNTSYDEYIKSGKKWELFLQPLTSIHLPPAVVYNRLNDSGDIKVIYSFIGAAIFIVLLSCVNFMNLSMAQFTRRIKEASVRKILGLGRKQLGAGYFLEALAFCLMALIAAMAASQMLLPGFNYIVGKKLSIDLFHDPALVLGLLALALFMAILSSTYPAFFLSAFHPIEAMKGKLKSGREGKVFRNGLVVFQFIVSMVLIVSTAVVFDQLKFISEKNLGFDKENLLVIKNAEGIKDKESFASATMNIPGVVTGSRCTSVPPAISGGDTFTAEGMSGKTFPINYTIGDERYLTTLGIKLKWGRNFSVETPGDADRVILNQAAILKTGWKVDESVIGKKLLYGDQTYEVVGVVDDFHYWPLLAPIEPMAIFHIKGNMKDTNREFVILRINGQRSEDWNTTLDQLHSLWKAHAGDSPFQFEFVDQAFAETFQTQQQFGRVLTVMSALSIVIACLGLLGIIIYSLEQRSKEIGIRKVSGASVWNILVLISRGYTRLILVAFLLATPLAYWMMQQWLQDFAYRITPSPWIFAGAGLGTLAIAIIITSYHSVKAALTNPVDVLKDE